MKQFKVKMVKRSSGWLKSMTVSLIGISLVCLASTFAEAARPDITGVWALRNSTAGIFQNGNNVKMVLIGDGYSHFFEGDYTGAQTIKGKFIRRNPEECVTSMSVTIRVISQTQLSLTWQGLDSYCDLKAGQTGTDSLTKVK